LSGPLLDRFDLFLDVPRLDWQELVGDKVEETSAAVRARVLAARGRQATRLASTGARTNQELSSKQIDQYCRIGNEAKALLKQASHALNFSNRAYYRILRVARTIADLERSEDIRTEHLAEALQYRRSG
jgi:magnesium chelatase family protein